MIKKLLKILGILFVLLIVLLIVAGIGLNLYVKNYIKGPQFSQMVVTGIENATHRKAEFKGLDYSLVPLSVTLNDVAIKNKDNTANAIALKRLNINISPLKAEITDIVLDSPELNVTQYADGSFDFKDMLPAPTEAKPETPKKAEEKPAGEAKPLTLPVAVNIALIRISNASLHYIKVDANNQSKAFDVPSFDLDLKNLSLENPIEMNLKTRIGQESSVEMNAKIGPVKSIPPDLANLNLNLDGDITIAIADLKALIPEASSKGIPVTGAKLNWNGSGTLASGFKFDLTATTPSLSEQNKVELRLDTGLQVNIPASDLQEILKGNLTPQVQKSIQLLFKGKLSTKAEFVPGEMLNLNANNMELNVNEDTLKIETVNFNHKSTSLQFNMDVKGLNPMVVNPQIAMKLSGDKLAVDELLKALPSSQANASAASESAKPAPENTQETPAAPAPAPAKEVDLRSIPFLEKILLDADVLIKEVSYQKNLLDTFTVKVHLEKGNAVLNPMSFNAFAGKVSDTAEANLLAYPLTFKTDFQIANLDINKACQANMAEANYYGILNMKSHAEGTGVTPPNLKQNLQANGNADIKKGKIISKGGSLEDRIYLALDNPLLVQAIPKLSAKIEKAKVNAEKESETQVEDFIFNFSMQSGKATLNQLQMGTPDYVLKANGDIYPFDDKIDMQTQFNFSEKATLEMTDGKDLSDKLPYENKGIVFPMTLTGKLSAPSPRPDIGSITKNLATKAIGKELGKLFGGGKGNEAKKGEENKGNNLGNLLGGFLNK